MLELLADHLWQSTLFAGAVAILARMCRENTAAVRHRLWLAASLKFVVPFALLTSISPHLGWLTSGPLAPESASFIEVIGQPFSVSS